MWEGLEDGVQVACMWATGVSRDATRWETVWEGYYPCTLAYALEVHERFVQALTTEQGSVDERGGRGGAPDGP